MSGISMFIIIIAVLCNKVYCKEVEDQLFTSKVLQTNRSDVLEYEGTRYYFFTEFQANFYSAFQFCKVRNMELLSIESEDENRRIGLHLIEKDLNKHRFWTSAINLVDSRKWTWLATGKEIKYFKWDAGEPTGNIPFVANYESCIQVRHEGNRGFTWNDLNCGLKNNIICEIPVTCHCINPRALF